MTRSTDCMLVRHRMKVLGLKNVQSSSQLYLSPRIQGSILSNVRQVSSKGWAVCLLAKKQHLEPDLHVSPASEGSGTLAQWEMTGRDGEGLFAVPRSPAPFSFLKKLQLIVLNGLLFCTVVYHRRAITSKKHKPSSLNNTQENKTLSCLLILYLLPVLNFSFISHGRNVSGP